MKAVSLLSGGLDSALATMLVKAQGVDILALYMRTGFENVRGPDNARHIADEIDVPLEVVDISQEFLRIVLYPEHGYGANANPCIDCHILMLRKAWQRAQEVGAKFIVTGHVLGQRPMSQRREALTLVEKEAGVKGLVVRPLSAKLLPPSIPEKEGWVDRERFLALRGRSRKPQLEMARLLGLKGWATPAGGCILTDPNYARRVFDLFEHREKEKLTLEDFRLLRLGRHFRLSPNFKLIVARNKAEDALLVRARKRGWLFVAVDAAGPVGLGEGDPSPQDLEDAARIVAHYSNAKFRPSVTVRWEHEGEEGRLTVTPAGYEFTRSRRL